MSEAIAEVRLQARALLTVGEVAAMLRLSVRASWRGVSAGRIPPPLHVGRSARWREAEIADWINAGCPPAARWTWTPKEGSSRCAR